MTAIRFNLMTMKPLGDAASNELLLAAFEPDFTPTHAGTEERMLGAYERSGFVAEVVAARTALGGEFHACHVVRKKPTKYAGYFWSRSGTLPSYITLTFDKPPRSQVAPIFAFAERLAAAIQVDYGTAHVIFPDATPYYNAGGRTPPKDLQKLGPMPLGARTWLGPHFVELIGRDLLEQSGVKLKDAPWGALRVDLLEDMPNQPMEALQARQLEVMARLDPTGVFAIYKPGTLTQKGPRWKPLS